ncbi:hypothetical protein CrV_gp049 [Cylindrospermopsis raciborskii virus RM-2018a]|nr:hypothetical protein CrV_gp049 [Cylindrospermopsis raciborskii virus RM-2018a]WHL30617.1 hypothetical protein CrLKS4_g51 [Cylindrospermopsis phage Cr-LKS4]
MSQLLQASDIREQLIKLSAIQESQIEMAQTATEIRIFQQLLQNKKVRMLIENILGVGSITGIAATVGYAGAAVSVALPVIPIAIGAVAFLWGAVTFLDELAKNR